MATSATNVIAGPEPGVILDSRYLLVERRAAVAGRPSYLARDLIDDIEVELIVTGEDRGQARFRVRGRARAAVVVGRRRRRQTLRDAMRQAAEEAAANTPAAARPDTLADAPELMSADEEQAFASLREMVALSGKPTREGHRVVYRGVERRTGRAVRVMVELDT